MSVFIVGNIVDFTICKLKTPIRRGESCIASEIQSTIGNDAAIVAIVLAKMGYPIVFGMLNPITQSLADKIDSFGIKIQNLKIDNSTGKTVLLESISGERTFISSYGELNYSYHITDDTKYIYFDLYDENYEDFQILMSKLKNRKDIQLFVNLSSSNLIDKCCFLSRFNKMNTIYIQLSYNKELVESTIRMVSQILPEAILILTCGCYGSYLSYVNKINYLAANVCKNDNYLGTGAFFSAFFLNALYNNRSLISAQEYATKNVGSLCKKGLPILLDAINFVDRGDVLFE